MENIDLLYFLIIIIHHGRYTIISNLEACVLNHNNITINKMIKQNIHTVYTATVPKSKKKKKDHLSPQIT